MSKAKAFSVKLSRNPAVPTPASNQGQAALKSAGNLGQPAQAAPGNQGQGRGEGEEAGRGLRRERRHDPLDPVDPAMRVTAQLGPPAGLGLGTPGEAAPQVARVSMESLVPELVRRIAWAGDRRRGTVQLELGAGPHAGTVVTVHSDEGRVRVDLHGGADVDALRDRIDARLRGRGLDVESVR
jgi:hypothetical protein